jgi:DNA-binding CsgD family transcriptional regulator
MPNSYDTDLRGRSQGSVPIPPALIFCWDQLHEPCGVKDLQSRFVYANKAYLYLLALPSLFDITGRLDSELPAATAEFSEQFQLHDRIVEKEQQRKSSLEIHPFGREKELKAYFFDKMPFFNNEGNLVGTYFHARRAEHRSLDFYMHPARRFGSSLILTRPSNIFTDGEWNVIFLLIQGKTQKEIARFLKFSCGYVHNRISVIFEKIGVSSARQLAEYCGNMGWNNYVPERFLTHRHVFLNG